MDNLLELVGAPWEYLTETEYQHGHLFAKYHRLKMGNETLTIDTHGEGWAGEVKVAAKTRLMAAAPDMYEALKATIRFMDDIYPADVFTGVSGDEGPARVVELRRIVEQALAKVEGREVR